MMFVIIAKLIILMKVKLINDWIIFSLQVYSGFYIWISEAFQYFTDTCTLSIN